MQAYVRVHGGRGGLRTRTYPLGTAAQTIQDWIEDTYREYRRKHPRGEPGTLARDVERYLPLLVDHPGLQRDRRFQLAWWCERFGHRSRSTLEAHELEAELNALRAYGSDRRAWPTADAPGAIAPAPAAASTVKKFRTALFHLFTKLDGKDASNPLRDVPPPREPDPLPHWIPPAVVQQIFDAIPDQRFPRRLDELARAAIVAAARQPRANQSAIAKAYGISETMVRKIVRQARRPRRRAGGPSQAKAILGVMAIGIPPAQIRQLLEHPEDVSFDEPSVLIRGRQKGGGTRPVRLPLTPAGVAALRQLFLAAPSPHFSMSSVDRAFRRGVDRLCDALERKDETRALGTKLRRELADATPYWLRHSFLTEVQLAAGNIHATQAFAVHADIRMTKRYTLAAVSPEMKAVAELLTARATSGQRPGNQSTGQSDRSSQILRENRSAREGRRTAKSGAKVAISSRK